MNWKKPLQEFLNETDEWHALGYGFFHSWKGLRTGKIPEEAKKTIKKEYHYYLLGYAIGRAVQATIIAVCGVTLTL